MKKEEAELLFVGENIQEIWSALVSTCQQNRKDFCATQAILQTWDKMNEEAPREKNQGSPAVNYKVFIRRFSNEKMYSFCWTFQTADTQNNSTQWQWSMHTAYMCVEEE